MPDIREIEVFAVGTWNGMKFTQDDLDEIVNNTSVLFSKGVLKPPVKLGHSTNQILKGQVDGDPALGWVENLKIKGQKIVADLKEIPEILFNLIKSNRYRKVSAELRHIPNTGWLFSGLALLGADLPAVKTLDDLSAFLSDTTDITDNSDLLFNFTLDEPTIHQEEKPNKEQNMPEETKIDNSDLLAKLKEQEQLISQLKEQGRIAAFNDTKSKTLESYKEDVKEGILQPSLYEKIEKEFDAQQASFSEGSRLTISPELTRELMKGVKIKEVKSEEEVEVKLSEGSTPDEELEKEINAVIKNTNVDYFTARDRVLSANPELVQRYKEYTLEFVN